ncbi:hypothetical protein LCGC14_1038070 [marine sediment metagenome]|uniref:Uncharacterized protein n=1 Tax=marine sediment metagenome TaxID=412755 RepID=A0A0F9QAX6_9ZZZZ
MIERKKRKDFFLFIISLILLILGIIWGITFFLGIGFCIGSCYLTVVFFGPPALLIFLGICSLINNPRMKGLLFLITGSIITGVALYFTRFLLLNPKLLKSGSEFINLTIFPTIIGILIIAWGIRQIIKKINPPVVTPPKMVNFSN